MAEPPKNGWDHRHEKLAKEAGKESWEAWIAEIEEEKGIAICGRISRNTRAPCRQDPGGNHIPACRYHGGKSLSGPALPQYKDGRKSKYRMGGKYAQAFAEMRLRPSDLSLQDQLDVLDAQAAVLLEGLPDNSPTPAGLRASCTRLIQALDQGDEDPIREATDRLRRECQEAVAEIHVREEVRRIFEGARKIVETELRRKKTDKAPPLDAMEIAYRLHQVEQVLIAIIAYSGRLQPQQLRAEAVDQLRRITAGGATEPMADRLAKVATR